jgi:hypothetical protein
MSMLTRHVLRSVRSIRYRLLTIAMICASTFGVVAGAYSSIDSLFDTVEQIQSASAMADLELVIGTEDQINVPRFGDLPTVAQVHQRLLSPGLLPLGQAQATAALLVSMPAEDFTRVNRLALTEGRLPAAGTTVRWWSSATAPPTTTWASGRKSTSRPAKRVTC